MRSRSSSRGHNTNASVTVTVKLGAQHRQTDRQTDVSQRSWCPTVGEGVTAAATVAAAGRRRSDGKRQSPGGPLLTHVSASARRCHGYESYTCTAAPPVKPQPGGAPAISRGSSHDLLRGGWSMEPTIERNDDVAIVWLTNRLSSGGSSGSGVGDFTVGRVDNNAPTPQPVICV